MNKHSFFATAIILIATLYSSNNLTAQWSESATAIYSTTLTKNVGIGTSTPTEKLQVQGIILAGPQNSIDEGGEIHFAGAGSNQKWIFDVYQSRFRIHNSGVEKLTFLQNGNVGIGTSTPTNARLQFDNLLGNKITLYHDGNNVGYGFGMNGSNLSAYIPGAGGCRFSIRTNNYNGAEKFVVTSDGNVGIGMNSPTSAKMQFDNTLGNKITLFDNGNNVAYGFGINGNNGGNLSAYIPAAAGSHFSIRTNNYDGAEKFVVTSDGNIGVGTSAPSYKLTVQTASNSLGIVHTDGNIKLATYVGGVGNGGYLGTQSNHALHFFTNSGSAQMSLQTSGKVGIGISDPAKMPGSYKLYVADGILTEKVKVALKSTSNWADYVFADDYKLRSLAEVEQYVQENKHLPGVPSAEEVQKTGIDVATMDAKLLEKIEELTLYMIDMKKENEALKARLNTLESKKQ